MKIGLLVLLSIVLAAAVAHAAIYEWTDSDGVVHFTDNRANIPGKYRNKAKRLKRYEEHPAKGGTEPQRQGSRTIPQPTPQGAPSAAPSSTAPSTTPRQAPQPTPETVDHSFTPGGHDEQWWRERFGTLREELKSLQEGLATKQAQLIELRRQRTIYQRGSDREAINALQGQISADEARINEVLNKITALELDAARAGVPTDWRQ
jgi:hypothetical protein